MQRVKFLFGLSLCFVVSFSMLTNAAAKAEQPNAVTAEQQILLLNLQYTSDTTTTREIQFYGNELDPNSSSVDDHFSLLIDGQPVHLPEQLYRRLNKLRRSFSYDSLSGGIQQPSEAGAFCMLGGPSVGLTLKARYLTYQTPEYRIVNDEMQPVFSIAENCLFTDIYRPASANAQEDARGVIEILNTLSLLVD